MANTKASGDSGATSSTEQAGTNATPDSGTAESTEFKSVELTRKRDGQTRTAHTLADKVRAEFDGFTVNSK